MEGDQWKGTVDLGRDQKLTKTGERKKNYVRHWIFSSDWQYEDCKVTADISLLK